MVLLKVSIMRLLDFNGEYYEYYDIDSTGQHVVVSVLYPRYRKGFYIQSST